MSDTDVNHTRPADPVGRVLFFFSYWLAMLGGAVMTGLALMVVVSVMGRWLFSSPIYGDFEMVAMGTAAGVSLFLPYCQLKKGNVVVDLFLAWASNGLQRIMDTLGAILLAAISGMLTWRLWIGTFELYEANETTMILGITIWWALPFITVSFAMLTVASLYTAARDLAEAAK